MGIHTDQWSCINGWGRWCDDHVYEVLNKVERRRRGYDDLLEDENLRKHGGDDNHQLQLACCTWSINWSMTWNRQATIQQEFVPTTRPAITHKHCGNETEEEICWEGRSHGIVFTIRSSFLNGRSLNAVELNNLKIESVNVFSDITVAQQRLYHIQQDTNTSLNEFYEWKFTYFLRQRPTNRPIDKRVMLLGDRWWIAQRHFSQ